MRKSFILLMVMFAIFACTNECLSEFLNECLTESNLENNSGNNQTDIDEPVKKFTTLQQVVNDTNAGEEIDLSEYKDLTDYSATVNKTLTIKNGSLNNAKLQITAENVKLEKIEKVSVSTSSRLTITNSKLSDLLIGGSGETSRSTPSSSEMTLAMVTVTDSEIENVELNGFNSQLNITDKTTKIEDIVISTKAKVILESGSYEGMKAPTVINDGEVARVDMTKKTELSVLSVYSSPQKLEYNIGDKIDLAGLIVMGTYSTDVETFKSAGWKSAGIDTITKCEDEKDYTVSYDFNTAGVSIVTVTSTKYPEIKCNFHVFVKELQNSGTSQPEKEEIEITEIELRSFGTPKTLYKVGEKLDLSCYQVVGTYNGFEINLPFTSEPLNGSDLKSSGEITVTFYYDYKPVSTQTITVTESYTVTFKDGEKTLYTLKVAGGELLKLPVVDERTGYTFDGWYKDDGTKIEAGDEVTGDVTLHAKWTADTYTIAYNLNGGNNVDNPTSYNVETETITLSSTTKTGYTFDGWYDNANLTGEKITQIAKGSTGNITLHAKWTADTYTIAYNLNGGNNVDNPTSYNVETETITLSSTTKTGYTFDGWYDNANLTGEKITQIAKGSTGNITLHAKWTADTYTIAYNLNGGNNVDNPTSYNVETETITLSSTTKTGYTFDGWYDNANLTGEKITQIAKGSTGNITLHAKWTADTYTIAYNLNGGNNADNPTSYNIETSTITLADPTKTGYTFGGWYTDETFSEEKTEITEGSTGDITLHAKWTANKSGITITLPESNDPEINLRQVTNGDKVTFTANGGFESYAWYIDGDLQATATSATFEVDTSSMDAANYSVMVIVTDSSQVYYSATAVLELKK